MYIFQSMLIKEMYVSQIYHGMAEVQTQGIMSKCTCISITSATKPSAFETSAQETLYPVMSPSGGFHETVIELVVGVAVTSLTMGIPPFSGSSSVKDTCTYCH